MKKSKCVILLALILVSPNKTFCQNENKWHLFTQENYFMLDQFGSFNFNNIRFTNNCNYQRNKNITHDSEKLYDENKFWRDGNLGFWIYSGTATIPVGYSILELKDNPKLDPLSDVFTYEYCASVPCRGSCDIYTSSMVILYKKTIPTNDEISALCMILHKMLFKEEWSPNNSCSSFKDQKIGFCMYGKQMSKLYDEALLRLKKKRPHTTIVDIWFGDTLSGPGECLD